MPDTLPPNEFARPIDLGRIGEVETLHDISATAEERSALAARFQLLGIDRLEARVRVRRTRGKLRVRLTGRFTADVIQGCVVTGDPVPGHIEKDFTVIYGDVDEGSEVLIEPEGEADFEPLPKGAIDLGETVAQELAMALDPYPRAPGAGVEAPPAEKPEPPRENPFAVLAKLKKTKD
jgi:uncharacterized metal-binding protein YceD (DUF177 family)